MPTRTLLATLPPTGVTASGRGPAPAARAPSRIVPTRGLRGQLIRFGLVGAVSTVAYAGLYLALRPLLGAFGANAVALLVTAIGNTAVNRRLTFGVRGSAGLAGHHLVGLLAFAAGLGLTSGTLAALHALTDPGRAAELTALTLANAVATLLRFGALRLTLVGRRVSRRAGPARTSAPGS